MNLIIEILFAMLPLLPAVAPQKLTTTQPTIPCDSTTITNCATVTDGNQHVNVSAISATPSGPQTGVNSDSVVCATDTRCIVAGPDANGAAATGNPVRIAGKEGSGNIRDLRVNASGRAEVDVNTISGVGIATGNGVTGTGSQRVTIASDNTAFSVNPLSATAPVSTMNSASANAGLNTAAAGVFDDTTPTSITENNFGFLRMSANRNQYTTIRDAAGNERGVNVTAGNALVVDASATTQPVSGTVTVGAFPDNEPFNVAQMNGVAVTMNNGAAGTGVQRVTLANDSTGNIATIGTSVNPGNGATHLGKDEDTAHTTADRGVAILGVRNDADGTPAYEASGADGRYAMMALDRYGAVMNTGQHPTQWTYHEDSSSALTDTTVHASCGTGQFNYITDIVFSTNAATAASIKIEDSTTTTILGPYYLEAVAGRGLAISFATPKKQTNSATLISVTTTGAIAHGLDIQGFCAP
jgi:hypothetical protein